MGYTEVTEGEFLATILTAETDDSCMMFAQSLAGDLKYLITAEQSPIMLRMREIANHSAAENWTITTSNRATVQSERVFNAADTLFETTARQHYVAIYQPDYNHNYCGQIVVELTMPGKNVPLIEGGEIRRWQADDAAERLVSMALSFYYQKIATHYRDWQSHYLDAADIQSRRIAWSEGEREPHSPLISI